MYGWSLLIDVDTTVWDDIVHAMLFILLYIVILFFHNEKISFSYSSWVDPTLIFLKSQVVSNNDCHCSIGCIYQFIYLCYAFERPLLFCRTNYLEIALFVYKGRSNPFKLEHLVINLPIKWVTPTLENSL